MKLDRHTGFYIIQVLVLCFFLGGCVNRPGALTMRLAADKTVIEAGEPIRLQATLVTAEGPVCVSNRYFIHAEMRMETNPFVRYRTNDPWIDATGFIGSMPFLWPVYLLGTAGGVLDVADVGNRFEVLETGEEKTHFLVIARSKYWPDTLKVKTAGETEEEGMAEWYKGEYILRVKLEDTNNTLPYPAPLFWKPYTQPVEAEMTITIQ